jgi:hypothetical protein
MAMQRTSFLFWLLGGTAVLSACGSDDGDKEIQGGGDGDNDGSDGQADGDADGDEGGSCGKGMNPSQGEVKYCPDADSSASCTAVEEVEGYTAYYGDIFIEGVSDLTPFACLAEVGQITIADSPGLRDLNGLSAVSDLGVLGLRNNPDLESLAGLDSLRALGTLNLIENGLTSLPGLPDGLTVGNLFIERHEGLTSLAGLEKVTVTFDLAIVGNPGLPQCEAEAFAARFEGITTRVEDNDLTASCD